MNIVRNIKKVEDLWAKGTNYGLEKISAAKQKNQLVHLDLDLTKNCNLRCFYCDRTVDRFDKNKNKKELSLFEKKAVIQQAVLLGAETVEIPGAGEPTLDKNFWELMTYMHSLGLNIVLFTNGYYLSKFYVDRLYDLGVTIFLKYNHTDPNVQDKIVDFPRYGEKVNEVMQLLLNKGFNREVPTRLAIDLIITPKYHDDAEIEKIFRFCRNNNIHMYMTTVIPEGDADDRDKILLKGKSEEIVEKMRQIDEKEFGIVYQAMPPFCGGYRCRQVNLGVHVNLYGEVHDCNGLGRFLGNVQQNSLEEIWNSRYAKHIRSELQDGYCIPRERVWSGIVERGVDRKLKEYSEWTSIYGQDAIIENGLQCQGFKEAA